jgi:antiviral helicase SLH1
VSAHYLAGYLRQLHDSTLGDFISRGIGVYHKGIHIDDRRLILELYAIGILRVLIAPRDSCWSLPTRAAVVVVMGTQYYHFEAGATEHQIRNYDVVEITQMQSRAVRHSGSGHFHLFCQAEAKDAILRFLGDGLPLESRLLETEDLMQWYLVLQDQGYLKEPQHFINALSYTFLARRIISNPLYYNCESKSQSDNLSSIVDLVVEKSRRMD